MSVASTTLYLPKALFVLGRGGGGLAQYAQTDVARSQRSNSVVPDPANLQRDRPVVQSTDDGCAALFEVGTRVQSRRVERDAILACSKRKHQAHVSTNKN